MYFIYVYYSVHLSFSFSISSLSLFRISFSFLFSQYLEQLQHYSSFYLHMWTIFHMWRVIFLSLLQHYSLFYLFFLSPHFYFLLHCTLPNPRQTHGSTTMLRPKPKPPSTQRHQKIPTPRTQATVNPTRKSQPREPKPPSTKPQIAAETKTQTHEQTETQTHKQTQPHRQPNHHQKINKGEGRAMENIGEGRAMENRGRERRKEREHSGENGGEEREKNPRN